MRTAPNFLQQGVLLAHFVDRLIQVLALPKKGGVLLAGWSLGNIFMKQPTKALFDLQIRQDWCEHPVWYIYI
jgi:hypothetical protein